ncbi:MAG: oligosaccharide flippase family protein [Candidatus Omnitrophota bacterium]|jgi:O-antigen/teichoic acid export membrane protein
MSLRKNFVWLLGGRGVSAVCIFLTGSIINRALGPYNRGVFAEIQTWIGLFMALFGFSLDAAIYHFSNKMLYGDDDAARLTANTALSLLFSILAAALLILYIFLKPKDFSVSAHNNIFLMCAILILTMLTSNWSVFLQSMNLIKVSSFIIAIAAIFNLVVIWAVYLVGVMDINLLLLSIVLVQFFNALLYIAIFFNNRLFNGILSLSLVFKMLIAGAKQHGATIAAFIYLKVNQLILFKFCGAEATGFFSMALTLALYLTVIPMALQSALYPRVIHSSDGLNVIHRSLKAVFYIWGAVVLISILFAKPIILLYGGSKFLPAINNFKILSIAFWFFTISSIVGPYWIKIGAFWLCTISAAALGVISIALNLLLIPRLASTGAALATLLTCMIGTAATLILFWRYSRQNPLIFLRVSLKDLGI